MASAALPKRESVASSTSTEIYGNGRRMSVESTASNASQWSQASTSHPHLNNAFLEKLADPNKTMVEFTASYAYDGASYGHMNGLE